MDEQSATSACPVCYQLRLVLRQMEENYARALWTFGVIRKSGPVSMYKATRTTVESARLHIEIARVEMERHKITHDDGL